MENQKDSGNAADTDATAAWVQQLAETVDTWSAGAPQNKEGKQDNEAETSARKSGPDEQPHFDCDAFLAGLDDIFAAHEAPTKAGPYLEQAMEDAENAGDDAGLLTVLNETMGFYRSQGRHDDNQWIIQRALELGLRMRIQGSDAWTTTLINAATSLRAAHRYDQAKDIYAQALDSARHTYAQNDRRLAALHNNISMLYSETGDLERAQQELEKALDILTASSTDPDRDLDVASTHTNLALVLAQRSAEPGCSESERGELVDEAMRHATRTLEIYRTGHLEESAHYASALAGYAQVCYISGQLEEAVENYRHALDIIEERYGKNTDYYRLTAANLTEAEQTLQQVGGAQAEADSRQTPHADKAPTPAQGTERHMPGLSLAQAYWEQYGKPMIAEKYPEYSGRIAAGLVGHGSECYGFDDEYSHDHDFGPRFCLWLTPEDYAAIGERLEADYESLPAEFMGFGPRESTVRAQGTSRRDGVFAVGTFFESLTGYAAAPAADKPHEWLLLDEPTLAAATNGKIFSDPLGLFSKTRQGFKFMPDDVRLSLISRRLGMIAQAGQYNLPRMLKRGDGAAAWLSIREFTSNVCSLVFLINRPETAGYMPYYKWQFAALRRLSGRTATRLKDVCGELESILRLSSAACFGGAGFGEGGKGSAPAQSQIQQSVETICAQITTELNEEGLSDSGETFLEWQRPYVEAHIGSADPILHSV